MREPATYAELLVMIAERESTIAALRTELTQWTETYARANSKLGEQELMIEVQRRELAELREKTKGRRCAATISTDPPPDCDAPFCGCNPEWHVALESARESGWLTSEEASKLQAELAELRKSVAVEQHRDAVDCRALLKDQSWQPQRYNVFRLLDAYDMLAQDCARYANAHTILMRERDLAIENHRKVVLKYETLIEERDGLRERLDAAAAVGIRQESLVMKLEERERQLRNLLEEAIYIAGIGEHIKPDCELIREIRAALAQPQDTQKCCALFPDSDPRSNPRCSEYPKCRCGELTDGEKPQGEQPKVDCEKCDGAGWLWGHELSSASEDTRNDTMTKYSCDGEAHEQESGNG